ncbi:M50 family metallopeptidase [Clostridium manihotivorum]|uniref:Peptidase M50 domain-containing protein n=1 Tax=Clostridium manihotivorum TaxID=2320868 RepID=A0A410DXC1_9CLOT|nr:hypothetical protein C1I91_19815 [Clostridium manihotivorum]
MLFLYLSVTLLYILIIITLSTLFHELGHGFFAKIFGGKIITIELGFGRKIASFGIFQIRFIFFWKGLCLYNDLKVNNKMSRCFIHIGGVLFNFFLCIICIFLLQHTRHFSLYLNILLSINSAMVLFNLLPITIGHLNTDGKQLYATIRYGSSSFENKH